MIYEFSYNTVPVKVDTEKNKITVPHPTLVGLFESYLYGDFRRDPFGKSIVVYVRKVKEDVQGNVDPSVQNLPPRTYGPGSLNSQGTPIYDFFYNQNGHFGTIADLACANNQLEEMGSVFGGKCACFNPFNDWAFFHPIHLTVATTSETISGNDGAFTVSVTDEVLGMAYECSIDNGVTWGSLTRTGLTAGSYTALVRSTTELVPASINFTITLQA